MPGEKGDKKNICMSESVNIMHEYGTRAPTDATIYNVHLKAVDYNVQLKAVNL